MEKLKHKSKTMKEIKEPGMYNVVLLNDNYTPADFVVSVLKEIFGKQEKESIEIMMNIHEKGKGVAGTYTKDIAMSKNLMTAKVSQAHNHPLKSIIEPV